MKKIMYLISLFLIITCFLGGCKGKNENNVTEVYSQGLEFELSEDGKSYTVIGYGTFEGEDLVIPSQHNGKPVLAIGDFALWGNHIIKSVVIPDSVVSIGEFAFYGCSQLCNISIGKSVSNIGDYGVWGNVFLQIEVNSQNEHYKLIDGHLCTIDGKELIYYSVKKGDTSIVVPNGITKIDTDSFNFDARFIGESNIVFNEINGSQYIGSVENPYLILYRSDYANNTVNIHKDTRIIYQLNPPIDFGHIVIPDHIEYICPSTYFATTFEVDENNPYYKMVDGGLYTKDGKTLVRAFPSGDEFTIIDGVETISYYAFASYLDIKHITMPNTVKRIEAWAFNNYTSLTEINISTSLEYIGLYALGGCGSESIIIPESIKTIAPYSFSRSGFKNIEISAPITRIDSCVFQESYRLEKISLPNTLTHIGKGAFMNCKSLKNIEIPNSVTYIGEWAFGNCSSLESVVIPDSVVYLGDDAFVGCGLKSVVIGNSVLRIADQFRENPMLESVVIGDSVETIEYQAFRNCSSLKSITLGNSVKEIESWAFSGCKSLESIVLPDTVKIIGEEAFSDCKSLIDVKLGSSVENIGVAAFYGCSSLESIVIPKSVITINEYAFGKCDMLTIYCEVAVKPDGWADLWNNSNCKVEWGYKN